MSEIEKIPLKRAEISAKKFNDVAIPHHLGLLKNHKSNIEKCLALGDWNKVKREEINAIRVIKQLKNLILEMDVFRSKVREEDLDKFDNMISSGRQKAMAGIREYLDLQMKSTNTSNYEEYDSPEQESEMIHTLPQIQAEYHHEDHQLQAQQACLEQFESLQHEVQDLYGMFKNVNEMVHEQGEQVEVIADNAEEALENVVQGESNLRTALKYKKTMYPVVGALVGTCFGGPIGLLVGLKAGGLAAIGCGILGFTGGSVLKKNEIETGIEEEKKDE